MTSGNSPPSAPATFGTPNVEKALCQASIAKNWILDPDVPPASTVTITARSASTTAIAASVPPGGRRVRSQTTAPASTRPARRTGKALAFAPPARASHAMSSSQPLPSRRPRTTSTHRYSAAMAGTTENVKVGLTYHTAYIGKPTNPGQIPAMITSSAEPAATGPDHQAPDTRRATAAMSRLPVTT